MPTPAFIGDELTAAGFRLAGLDVYIADPASVEERFRDCLESAPLVILTADAVAMLPDQLVASATIAADPPVAVLQAAVGGRNIPDLERDVRRALGVDS